jgi:hypothetical protein
MSKKLACLVLVLLVLGPALVSVSRAELVGWWKFDETSGTVANDSSGGGNNGAVLGGGQWVAGQLAGALRLDGVDDYVSLPVGPLMGSLGDCTLGIWVNFTGEGNNWQRVIDFGTGTANYIYLSARDATGMLHAAITANTGAWTDLIAPLGLPTGWHHLGLVIDGKAKRMKVMLDGEIVVEGSTLYTLADLGSTNNNWIGRSQYADPYFNGSVDDLRIYNEALTAAQVKKVSRGEVGVSSEPSPANEAVDVPRDSILGWTAGEYAATHDVYLGTSLNDVRAATRTNPLNVLVGKDHQGTTLNPGRLQFGQTYYWRVDEVNAAPSNKIFTGQTWKFAVEPYSYPIADVNAAADSAFDTISVASKTVDGSGLDASDQHSTATGDMWISARGAFPHWIEYTFDKAYKLDQMWVWNSNQALEVLFGMGAKDVTIQYSADGTDWTDLGNFVFAKAPGAAGYVADTKIDFAGVVAKYVKLTITSNWSGIFQQASLSEVRFYYLPVVAREPSPAPDATNVHPQVTLSWRAGREAGSHEVYLSTDPNAVADGTALKTTVSQPMYETAVNLEDTYYWKVVEVNQTETPTSWASDVWSFAAATYINLDDFEGYNNDSPKRLFQTWVDGSGFSADEFFPSGNPGNGTGSLVGYDPLSGNIMETTLVYAGTQSMPLYYDNSAAPKVSEAIRTFDPVQDWTKHGITTLVLFVRGKPDNAPAPIYVKINDTKILYNNGAASTTTALWKQWNIDLGSVAGATLKSVKTLTIGVGDGTAGGTGTILVDEIRLYATAPQVVTPVDPGTNDLAALYAMDGDLKDSSGKGLNALGNGDPGFADGKAGFGKAVAFDGVNDYIDLPIGNLISTLGSSTFAAWVNPTGTANWERVFDFGTGTTVYMFLTVRTTNGMARFAITTGSNAAGAESMVTSPMPLGTGWRHLAVVIDSVNMTETLYFDGVPVVSGPTATLPRDMGVTTQNWLGRSQWSGDAYYNGLLDDVRIYDRALSEAEVRYLAGDR